MVPVPYAKQWSGKFIPSQAEITMVCFTSLSLSVSEHSEVRSSIEGQVESSSNFWHVKDNNLELEFKI